MERDASSGCLWPFFATCGAGMEPYVVKELWTCSSSSSGGRSSTRPVFSGVESTLQGKVFFESLSHAAATTTTECRLLYECLSGLKSVERIFVSIARHDWQDRHTLVGGTIFESVRQACSRVAGTDRWRNGFHVWSLLTASIRDGDCAKRIKLSPDDDGDNTDRLCEVQQSAVAFRMSSKCSGRISSRCPPQRLTGWIANSVDRHLAGTWISNPRKPDLEVYAHLNDTFLIIGFVIPSDRQRQRPLSKRLYLDTIGLRSTVCWAMATAAHIKPGDVLLDPMCGVGTLLVEAVVSYPVDAAVGLDIDPDKLAASGRNVASSGTGHVVHLAHGSVCNLPFRDNTFDVVLCDFPFGLMTGTKSVAEARLLLPKAVRQIERTCREGARVVFLLSLELHELLVETVADIGRSPLGVTTAAMSVSYVPRSVRAAAMRNSTSVDRTVHNNTAVLRSAGTWKRLSVDRLKLGELEACIVAHVIKKRRP